MKKMETNEMDDTTNEGRVWINSNTLQTYSDAAVEELVSLGLAKIVADPVRGLETLLLTPQGKQVALTLLSERN